MADIIQEALDLFTDQFQESEALMDLSRALMQPLGELNQVFDDLQNLRSLDTAQGRQLDLLGDMVGEERRGRTDDVYRNAIKFRIFINISKGEPETIIQATRVLSQGDFIRYWENYPAGFQVFTNGPNVIDITGEVFQIFDLALDDGGPLELDDGGLFKSITAYEAPEGLADFLSTIAPAGTDPIALTFSLGITPLFGYGGDFISTTFTTDDGGLFNLDDGGTLDVYTGEIAPSTDGYEGFSEMFLQRLVTDDSGDFYLSSNIVDPIICPLLTNGIGAIGSKQLTVVVEEEQDVESFFMSDDGGVIVTDDGGELEVFAPAMVTLEDYLVLENGDEFGLIDYLALPGEGNLLLDDDGELELYVFNVLDDPGPLLVFDQNQNPVGGGLLPEGVVA